jgi:hypothetical protein
MAALWIVIGTLIVIWPNQIGSVLPLVPFHLGHELPGIDLTVIEPEGKGPENGRTVRGTGTEASILEEAGIMKACGIVAGSDNDVKNLSIAMMPRN